MADENTEIGQGIQPIHNVMDTQFPRNQIEYLVARLGSLPMQTRTVLVYDPDGVTCDRTTVTDGAGKSWTCLTLWRNLLEIDLRFKNRLSEQPLLICVVPPLKTRDKLDLVYIPQVAAALEDVIDLSLNGIIRYYEPDAALPAGSLDRYSALLHSRLDRTIEAYRKIRKARQQVPLQETDVQLMALQAAAPDLLPNGFLAEAHMDLARVLKLLLWPGLSADGEALLRTHLLSRVTPGSKIRAWLEVEKGDASAVLYVARVLQGLGQPLSIFTLRGMGLTTSCLDGLAPGLMAEADGVWQDQELVQRVYDTAEGHIGKILVERLEEEVLASSVPRYKLAIDLPPLIARGVLRRELLQALKSQDFSPWLVQWANARKPLDFDQARDHLLEAISVLASIKARMAYASGPTTSLGALVDRYVESGASTLEFDLWRLERHIKQIEDQDLHLAWAQAQRDLRRRIRARLLEMDQTLAMLVSKDGGAYLEEPNLVTHVLKDMVSTPGRVPPHVERIWFLIFDGMRWDLWSEVVRPALESYFEVQEVRRYLALLPSITRVSRTSLIAGQPPDLWKSPKGSATESEEMLAAAAFGIGESQRQAQLTYLSRMENRSAQAAEIIASGSKKPYNVLIYNLSDDWIHRENADIFQVGRIVDSFVRNSIIPDLRMLIESGDVAVISSDHGFIELDPSDQQEVALNPSTLSASKTTPPAYGVSYRYSEGVEIPTSAIEIGLGRLGTFYVATGHTWFKYPNAVYTKYSHGGVSLSEMVVPGAVLQRKSVLKTVLLWQSIPPMVEAWEDEAVSVDLKLTCTGHEQVKYSLVTSMGCVSPSSGDVKPDETVTFRLEVSPEAPTGVVRISGNATSVSGQQIKLEEVSFNLLRKERTDRVKFDQGALDLLEKDE